MNFDEIDEARKLFGLGEMAPLKEIKSAYRRLSHHLHPDKHGGAIEENNEMMKKLNRAYKLLLDYCNDYKYSFRKEDVSKTYPFDEELSTWRDKWSF